MLVALHSEDPLGWPNPPPRHPTPSITSRAQTSGTLAGSGLSLDFPAFSSLTSRLPSAIDIRIPFLQMRKLRHTGIKEHGHRTKKRWSMDLKPVLSDFVPGLLLTNPARLQDTAPPGHATSRKRPWSAPHHSDLSHPVALTATTLALLPLVPLLMCSPLLQLC